MLRCCISTPPLISLGSVSNRVPFRSCLDLCFSPCPVLFAVVVGMVHHWLGALSQHCPLCNGQLLCISNMYVGSLRHIDPVSLRHIYPLFTSYLRSLLYISSHFWTFFEISLLGESSTLILKMIFFPTTEVYSLKHRYVYAYLSCDLKIMKNRTADAEQ